MTTLRAATRASALALWQTRHIAALLAPLGIEIEEVLVSTSGDRNSDVPIHTMGGKGVFVKEVQAAVLDGRADIAVHSMKDLPSGTPDGLVLAAVPARADARDALVGSTLDGLAHGATVATGSIRRRAQLQALRPDLTFYELRGNIATRLAKASDFDAIIMAAAALQRLGEAPSVIDILEPEIMLPQVGQGALAVEADAANTAAVETLAAIQDPQARLVTDAERAFLGELGGDCDLPAGAYATANDGEILLRSLLAAPDGTTVLQDERRGTNPHQLGTSAAAHLLASGGRAILDASRPGGNAGPQ